jgi:hypothetical protein
MSAAVPLQHETLSPRGAARWARKNLFSSPLNTLLTVFAGAGLVLLVRGLLHWVFFTPDWAPVTQNLRLFMVGQYPSEQAWRVAAAVFWVFTFSMSFASRRLENALGVGKR